MLAGGRQITVETARGREGRWAGMEGRREGVGTTPLPSQIYKPLLGGARGGGKGGNSGYKKKNNWGKELKCVGVAE